MFHVQVDDNEGENNNKHCESFFQKFIARIKDIFSSERVEILDLSPLPVSFPQPDEVRIVGQAGGSEPQTPCTFSE